MIIPGQFNTLEIVRRADQGFYLEDELRESVLLPNRYIPQGAAIGDTITVFIYYDSEDRIIATTLTPNITLNKFACLKVKAMTPHGAFLDWGLVKDLFVPFNEQARKMEEGEDYIVFLYLDKLTNRLAASSKTNKFLVNENIALKEKEEVNLLIAEKTDMGVNVIINDRYRGILYKNEIFQNVKYGERVTGYIKKIRDDNKIDVCLQKSGYENVLPNEEKIINKLKGNDGFLKLNDNSSPEEIVSFLQMSKKTFKKAIGSLYKQRIIRIEEDGIYLINR